jgi:uncharacterized surface protein with fasciclin (FAS1) repeats
MIRKFLALALAASLMGLITAGCSNTKDTRDDQMNNAPGNIIDVATAPGMDQLSTLVSALKAADLVDTLKGTGPYTVFAPTNEAFAKLPQGTLDNWMKPENKEQLRSILLYHVVLGRHDAAELQTMKTVNSMQGNAINISVASDHRISVGNSNATAKVIRADITATNGVIHWVDTVMMP